MKVDKADDVEAVVLERRLQQGMHVTAQIVEVSVRHQGAGDWVVALVSEQPLLDRPEIAVLQAMAIERPDQGEQVHVRRAGKLAGHASHHPPRSQR